MEILYCGQYLMSIYSIKKYSTHMVHNVNNILYSKRNLNINIAMFYYILKLYLVHIAY